MYCKSYIYLVYLLHDKLCHQQISIDSSDTLATINRIIESVYHIMLFPPTLRLTPHSPLPQDVCSPSRQTVYPSHSVFLPLIPSL